MEKENRGLYKYGSNKIKELDIDLWNRINNFLLDLPFKEKFYLVENLLTDIPKCECGNSVKFIDMVNGYREFCSRRCMYDSDSIKKSKRETCIEKWGVDNPSKVKEVRDRVKKTNIEKFGHEWATKSDLIKEKIKDKFIENWGVDNPSKIREVREKAENTMMGKYGVKHALQNVDMINKMKETNLVKYGETSFTKTYEYRKIIDEISFIQNSKLVNDMIYKLVSFDNSEYEIDCSKCKSRFIIQRQLFRNRKKTGQDICLNCYPISNGSSIGEKSLFDFISSIDTLVLSNKRIQNREMDVYLPEFKIGFEYNGLYWHSELNKPKDYHFNKSKFFEENGINLMHVWEDDWIYRQDIVKSIILNIVGKSERIFARKCEVKEVDRKMVGEFLKRNHIQGFVGSKIKVGLFHKNELVSLMTFGGIRKSLGQISKDGHYELLRFCNKLNTSVIGGASKLFNYFIKNYKPIEIISYSDSSRSTGNLYDKLGFELYKITDISYYWSKNGIRYHRFNFRKDKLVSEGYDKSKTEVEIMSERGFYRIFDCGNKKWIFKNS